MGRSVKRANEDRAFLGWRQQTRAARFSFNGRNLTIWLGQRYYLLQAMIGTVFGPGVTFLMLLPGADHSPSAFASAPLFIKLVLILVMFIGWATLAGAIFGRRTAQIDFVARTITLTSRFVSVFQQIFGFDEIATFTASSVYRNEETNDTPVRGREERDLSYVFGFRLREGRTISALETTRQDVVRQIAQIVQKETRGQFEVSAPPWAFDPPMTVVATHEEPWRAPPGSRRAALMLVAFCVAFLAFAAVVFSGIQIIVDLRQQHWPTTSGTVIVSRTWRDTHRHLDSDGESVRHLSTQAETTFSYRVAGREYKAKSNRVELTRRYHAGDTVRVSYNPKNIADATIDPAVAAFERTAFLGGLSVVAVYIAFIWMYRRAIRRDGGAHA